MARERGIALISVIWILGIIAVLATMLATDSRNVIRSARGIMDLARARAIAEAGVSLALINILNGDPTSAWPTDGVAHRLSFDGAIVDVAIRDEGGKVDLNFASPELLHAMTAAAGIGGERAEAIVREILAWREPPVRRAPAIGGRTVTPFPGRTYGPQQAPFAAVDELRLLPAVTHDIYARLRPYATVYSETGTVNPRSAPPALLAELPGINRTNLAAFLAGRGRSSGQPAGPSPFLGNIQAFSSETPAVAYGIRCIVFLPSGPIFVRDVIVQLSQDDPAGYRIVSWQQGEDDGSGP